MTIIRTFTAVLLCTWACGQAVVAQSLDSLDIKIGQMILIGMPKAEVDANVLEEVRMGKAGAIIFFEKNIPKTNSYMAFKRIAWTYHQAAPIPLLITIDQEGGLVNRLKEKYGFPRSMSAMNMGKDSKMDSVRFYGASTGATLAGLGINVNFAPSVDVAVNPDNTVIVQKERSFSADEKVVTAMAKEFIKTHRKVNVITAIKHFPGHGSSQHDTHFGMADVTNTWQPRELFPYQSLIDSGYADMVMTSHIVNQKLDPSGLPGTLSKRVLDSLLRKQMGYNGVIVSDDMQMHAITLHYGLDEAIKLAVNAGVDIMCFSNNIQGSEERTVDKVHTIIRQFVNQGIISASRIDESYRRVMKLKERLTADPVRFYDRTLVAQQQEIDSLQKQTQEAQVELEKAKETITNLEQILSEATSKKKKKKKR